jgi:IclR family pca regulon transcriptional regulator
METDNPDFVSSLARGLAVITAFSAETPSMTLTEVAEKIGLTRATARRFLLTLETLGYVRSTGKEFALTPKVMELGFSYLSSLGLTDVVTPHLATLSSQVHESASAAILDGHEIVYIARSAGRKIMQVQITVGTRFPAYATSMGRVLLADLAPEELEGVLDASTLTSLTANTTTNTRDLAAEIARVRQQGFAFVDQELELGLRSLAVPIRGRGGRVVAALNISTGISLTVEQTIEALLPPLRECAARIETELF